MSVADTAPRPRKSNTWWLIAPGAIWMALFLVAPIALIVYVSFWTQTTFKIEPSSGSTSDALRLDDIELPSAIKLIKQNRRTD
ncbi:MAG TPA: hypothetical protein PK402_08775 [Tepidisphaeraceae bacterium]|nr:hypothetical protein [Tepidisphaeraceae bacterium]